jgi:hypothetical protein
MYKVLTITNHKTKIQAKTKDIIKAQDLVNELREQGQRAYYIKEER